MTTIDATPARITTGETLRLLRRALRYTAPVRRQLAVKVAFTVASLVPLLLLPWPLKILVDHVIEAAPIATVRRPYPFFVRPFTDRLIGASTDTILVWTIAAQAVLLLLVGAFGTQGRDRSTANSFLAAGQDTATTTENESNAGFSLVGGLLGMIDVWWTMRLTQALNHRYRTQIFAHVLRLPMRTFDDARIGDTVYRVLFDSASITNVCYRLILTPIVAPLGLLLSAGVIWLVFGDQPLLVWSAVAFLPLALLVTLPFAAAVRRTGEQSRIAGAATTATVEENLANVAAVQSLGMAETERQRFARDSWRSFGRFRRFAVLALGTFLVALVPAIIVGSRGFLYIVNLVIDERLTVGDVPLLFAYFLGIMTSAVDIGALWIAVQGSAPGLRRAFQLLDLAAEEDRPGARALGRLRSGITVERASFTHDDGRVALRDVDLEVRVGELVALVGPAGAGKTTLASVVAGFIVPQAGRVLADGTDVAAGTRDSLRAQVGFVFQETAVFDGTIADNIRLGRPDAGELEVRRAAALAGVDEFVSALPDGYSTRVGTAGARLSVGQRQRVAIARAFVRDPTVLILDEPTAALDSETERRLLGSLAETKRDRAVLVVSHRLSTARIADRIVFLSDGRVVEHGTHEELASRPGGAYRRYLELQRGAA
jgi:ABC-type multidrug transport system fused ATPase/permease subunit